MEKRSEKFVIIDGNSLLNRAFYATPLFTTKEGFPSNAVFGFVKLLLKIIGDKKPQYLAVAFDLHAPTFRHKMYDRYKAGRRPMPQELVVQVPVLKEVLRLMRVRIFEKEGYEADDIIGTLSKKFSVHSYIYTGDRDAYQLVSPSVNVCFTRKGVSDLLELTEENFFAETGLTPDQIVDLKSLMGDKSDNIPGVAGIGELTAKNLLHAYSSLQGVYDHIEELPERQKARMKEGKESASLSYALAKIKTDVPLEASLSDCVLKTPFPYAVRQKFAELDFRTLASLDVFEEASPAELSVDERENAFSVETRVCGVEEMLAAIEANEAEEVTCVFGDKQLRALVKIGGVYTECVLNIRETLLEDGVFAEECVPVYRKIAEGKKTLLCYDVKSAAHLFYENGVALRAAYEDVGIVKHLAEGSSSAETLSYLLDAHGYPAEFPAAGLYRLYSLYYSMLSAEERVLYKDTELPLVRVLFEMETEGIRVDKKAIDDLSEKYDKELKELTAKIYELAGETFNLNSPAQLSKILFDKLHIDGADDTAAAGKKSSKKNRGTSAEILEKYADDYEIVRLTLRFRQVQKLNSTYVEGMRPLIAGDRIHTTYNQTNTSTGRLSSVNPNLQNIPIRTEEGRELRKIFLASEGNVLVDADYSQIELRLLAHFSDCEVLKNAYKNGEDIHAATAAQVFGVPTEEVTSQMRREAKAVNFGIIYGMSAFGLSKDLGISAKAAREYIDKYFELHGEVRKYIDENLENAKKNGYVTTLFGRRREIKELRSASYTVRSFGERAAMNMPLQGTGADIVKIAMIRVRDRFLREGMNAKLVLQVHDELVVDCPENEREKAQEILKYEMENAARLKVPLVADIGAGKNWYEAH